MIELLHLTAKANIVGLGTTTAGIGTHRFLTTGQPIGAERSARFESTVNVGVGGSISFATIDKNLDSSVKSLVRVSTGQTSAIHQVVAVRDSADVLSCSISICIIRFNFWNWYFYIRYKW